MEGVFVAAQMYVTNVTNLGPFHNAVIALNDQVVTIAKSLTAIRRSCIVTIHRTAVKNTFIIIYFVIKSYSVCCTKNDYLHTCTCGSFHRT